MIRDIRIKSSNCMKRNQISDEIRNMCCKSNFPDRAQELVSQYQRVKEGLDIEFDQAQRNTRKRISRSAPSRSKEYKSIDNYDPKVAEAIKVIDEINALSQRMRNNTSRIDRAISDFIKSQLDRCNTLISLIMETKEEIKNKCERADVCVSQLEECLSETECEEKILRLLQEKQEIRKQADEISRIARGMYTSGFRTHQLQTSDQLTHISDLSEDLSRVSYAADQHQSDLNKDISTEWSFLCALSAYYFENEKEIELLMKYCEAIMEELIYITESTRAVMFALEPRMSLEPRVKI